MYADMDTLVRDTSDLLRVGERLTVPAAAEKYVRTESGDWSNDLTYYMVKPAESLTSRMYKGLVFVGPARTGKSQALGDNWVAHNAMCDPMDMLLVFPSAKIAEKFSKMRIDKMHRHSPDIRARLGSESSADNIGEKAYISGERVFLVSPTKNTLATLDFCKVWLSDYERYDLDIGGDGSAWVLGSKRTQTFLSRAMTCAESSPSRPILDPAWVMPAGSPHQAPPAEGVLELYNEGTRHRLYAKCQHCGEYWLPGPDYRSAFIPDAGDYSNIKQRAKDCGLPCERCGCINTQTDLDAEGFSQEHQLKRSGVWVAEGQKINMYGEVTGQVQDKSIDSYWMPGWFAAFQSWAQIFETTLSALESFEQTGREDKLKSTVNVDQGAPFLSLHRQSDTTAKALQEKANELPEGVEPLPRGVVPLWCRYLIATVDNQKHSFDIQVHGFGERGEYVVIDRFAITVSDVRKDVNGRPISLEAAVYEEDWEILFPELIDKKYPTEDGREMSIHCTGMDMHGVPGLSPNARQFWRECKKQGKGDRVRLLRGGSSKHADLWKLTFPDSRDKTTASKPNMAIARGDVPVLTLNTDTAKDMAKRSLDRKTTGPGYLHLPSWAGTSFFEEIVAEIRSAAGVWSKVSDRNETLDHLQYAQAINDFINGNLIDWSSPPGWAADWDINTNVAGNSEPKGSGQPSFFDNDILGDSDPWLN